MRCARVRVCTAQEKVQVRCTAAVSCRVLFVYGALRRVTEAESSRLPAPKGVTPAAARTILFLVLPVRSCREGPEHFGPTLLASQGSRRQWVVRPRSCVSRQRIHNPKPLRCMALDPQAAPVRIHNPEPRIHNPRLFSARCLDPRQRAFRCTTSDPQPSATRAHRLCPRH